MKKLLLLSLLLGTSNTLSAETIDEKRYRTSPLLTKSQVVAAINAKILADQFKSQLNDKERMAFVDIAFASDIGINDLPATAAGNIETMDEMRYRTSPFSKGTASIKKVEGLSDHYNNLLDDRGRKLFVDAALLD
jgi:hypothetical protein